jgi:hypothetical protein
VRYHFFRGVGLSAVPLTFLVNRMVTAFILVSHDTTAYWHMGTNLHSTARMMNDVVSGAWLGIHAYV